MMHLIDFWLYAIIGYYEAFSDKGEPSVKILPDVLPADKSKRICRRSFSDNSDMSTSTPSITIVNAAHHIPLNLILYLR